eukprot:1442267-Pyramimonas_sp.AAC.1
MRLKSWALSFPLLSSPPSPPVVPFQFGGFGMIRTCGSNDLTRSQLCVKPCQIVADGLRWKNT